MVTSVGIGYRNSGLGRWIFVIGAWAFAIWASSFPLRAEPPAGATAPPHTNRLAKETSPYLLQHAHNPVDWYPWGDEAFAKAKQDQKPIFLSVGYSSCHWCHVMERESFLDAEIAAYLNEHFICIKVDREERPDVDAIYMTAVQIYNEALGNGRSGGWPMSVFMTPESKPFYGGTYLPARDGDRGATTGFITLLHRVQDLWTTQRDSLEQTAAAITKHVQAELDGVRPSVLGDLNERLYAEALVGLQQRFDPNFGGFGYSAENPAMPKFPEPSNLLFLVHVLQRDDLDDAQREAATKMLVTSLEHMSLGGIRDHVGGGFHRYSVDRYWRIPHFEKMLYDNGQLATVYAAAYKLTQREDFRRVAEELSEFVLREMTDAEGGFYSALDAESEGEEGKFYRWTKDEVATALSPEELKLFSSVYGLDGAPNFEGEFYALQLAQPLSATAEQSSLSEGDLEARLRPLREKLLVARDRRPRPLTDTKILTSWNGLMLRGLADAGHAFEQPRYIAAAEKCADFLLTNLRTPDGRLQRTYGQGTARLNAYLDDYAFVVDGLIALHKATGKDRWLNAADELTAMQLKLFWDDARGGFYFTSGDHESLLARSRDAVDGAEPSGNSVSADNLVYLGRVLKRTDYLDRAQRTIESAAGLLQAAPHAAPRLVIAHDEWLRAK